MCPVGSHCSGMLPHRQATRLGNMLSVNQEIPEELVQVDEAVFCPLKAGQMSVGVLYFNYYYYMVLTGSQNNFNSIIYEIVL